MSDSFDKRDALAKQRRDRQRGGLAKKANSPAQAARAAARELWPEADRKGWTAAQFHRALTDAGVEVPFDFARKRLTELRKTGTC